MIIPLLWGGFWVRSRRMLIWCTAPKGSKSSLSSVSDQERGICPTNILIESGSGWSKCSSDPFILLPLPLLKQDKRFVVSILEFEQNTILKPTIIVAYLHIMISCFWPPSECKSNVYSLLAPFWSLTNPEGNICLFGFQVLHYVHRTC